MSVTRKRVSGIELIVNISTELRHKFFDEFEIHPCKVIEEVDIPNKLQLIEQCEPNEAQFWSVYIHIMGGGLDCIADCETEQHAKGLVEFLKTLCIKYSPDEDTHM